MRLLIAEDDTRLLKSLKHIFEANQYMVDAVSNGMDALAYAKSEEYDGLIFDIMMPGNGWSRSVETPEREGSLYACFDF